MATVAAPPAGRSVKAMVWVFASLAATACGLTMLFLGMRSVMEIGGACADGGPFVPRQPCPEGVPLLIVGGIWGGLIACGLYAWQALKNRLPNLLGLAWPALFLSLGWNFFEFGIDPPGQEGVVWGWLICGVLFALMGGLPLLAVVKPTIRSFTLGTDVDLGPSTPVAALRPRVRWRPASTPAPASGDLVDDLERLEALRRSGALTEQEYRDAKKQVIEEGS
jgi:hypothetical protein